MSPQLAARFPLKLFVATPNQLHALGEGRDLYMPNPRATSAAAMQLFEFLGLLMGVAMRTRVLLALDLPRLFWKTLTEEPTGRSDLQQIDHSLVVSVLVPLEQCPDEATFMERFESTLPALLDGTPFANQPLQYGLRAQYAAHIQARHLKEFACQVAAIKRGMGRIVPVQVLACTERIHLLASAGSSFCDPRLYVHVCDGVHMTDLLCVVLA